ncbi:MAG: GNAT family N-acetyltransferase [Spirochaetaceae bacterium]|nr:MAG: GNAT family N-acetyltransferase [Spirochaetaceae bacterium]
MRWYTAREKELHEVCALLRSREWACVAFSERLLREGRLQLPPRVRERIIYYRDEDQRVAGAILQTISGVLLPCLPRQQWQPRLTTQLAERLRRGSLSNAMIMGAGADVRLLESLLPRRPTHTVDYLLMVRERLQPETAAAADWFQIRRADQTDSERLAPLQLCYEIEEVLLPGRTINSAATLRGLRARLRTQQTYLAHIDGEPIAMAGTNARGFSYDQVGGVFTLKEYRNRGVSRALMAELTRTSCEAQRRLSLFVKPSNQAAIHIYKQMGFVTRDSFRISYYN